MALLKVFLDTNVLLDNALKRDPWYGAADRILDASGSGEHMRAYLASTSLKDVYYIATRSSGEAYARQAVRFLMDACEVVEVSRSTCECALNCGEPDFEDGIIAAAAQDCGADVILTRDAAAFAACETRGIALADPRLFSAFYLEENPYPQAESEEWAAAIA